MTHNQARFLVLLMVMRMLHERAITKDWKTWQKQKRVSFLCTVTIKSSFVCFVLFWLHAITLYEINTMRLHFIRPTLLCDSISSGCYVWHVAFYCTNDSSLKRHWGLACLPFVGLYIPVQQLGIMRYFWWTCENMISEKRKYAHNNLLKLTCENVGVCGKRDRVSLVKIDQIK